MKLNLSEKYHHYIRLETLIPVEFQIFSRKTGKSLSGLQQGFTRNIGESGICLEVKELQPGLIEKMSLPDAKIVVYINIPQLKEPVQAEAIIKLSKKIKEDFVNTYLFYLEYLNIQAGVGKQIAGYAKRQKKRSKIYAAGYFTLISLCLLLVYQSYYMRVNKNQTEHHLNNLGLKLEEINKHKIALEDQIDSLNGKKELLEDELRNSRKAIFSLESKLSKLASTGNQLSDRLILYKNRLEEELSLWREEKNCLMQQISSISISKNSLDEKIDKIDSLEKAKIVKVQLKNGCSMVGELLEQNPARITLKIGLGTIVVEKDSIADIKEVSGKEKNDIQNIWDGQEEQAKKEAEKYTDFIKAQKEKGLVYFNGKWLLEEEAIKIKEELGEKEKKIFKLIAAQRDQSNGERSLLEQMLEVEGKPIISIKNNRIYVNGRLFFIKGIGYGIEYPATNGGADTYLNTPLSVFERDFKMIKAAGINTIRTYEPLPIKLLDLADKYSIMVIENICYPCDNSDFSSRIHLEVMKEQIRKYVSRDKDRRCILMWSIWNDAPWPWFQGGNVVQKYGFSVVNSFLEELYKTVKETDVSHPVTASNVPGLEGSHLGWNFLDIIGLNVYLGGLDLFVEAEAKRQIEMIKEISERYKKPIVILETGCSTFIQGQNQAEILEKHIKLAGTNVAGITIFQWADGWQKAGNKDKQDTHIEEHWGIMDGYRNPKAGYDAVKRLFTKIKTDSFGYEK